jgi:hypothetical protein
MTLSSLKALTVDAFPLSLRRAMLFAELERLASEINSASACCELWIDGSFLTEKPEPDDIDLTVVLFPSDFENLPDNVQKQMWLLLRRGKKFSEHLHTFLIFRFLREDPRYAADNTAYWGEVWGKGWDDWLTGFVVVRFGESDVGLRLFA